MGLQIEKVFKVGSYNPYGWAAYMLEKALFIKRFPVGDFRMLPDMGSNVEVYVWDSPYLELETLGPLVSLNPGESVTFEETWEVIPGDYPITYETARTISKTIISELKRIGETYGKQNHISREFSVGRRDGFVPD